MATNIRKWREEVYIDTQKRASHYACEPSVKVRYERIYPRKTSSRTEITVINADSIDAAKAIMEEGHNPLVLNFANDRSAGGGVGSGAGAQEESLWRRTNLCETQDQDFYPLRASPPEGVYSPKVTVFKSKESEGCELLTTPFQLSFIAVPAIRNPYLEACGLFSPRDAGVFRRKVELVCQVAMRYGHDSLVLGPFGCGAWNCPPKQVAEIFAEVLEDWGGVFKKVVFACYCVQGTSVRYSDQSVVNYEIFKTVLGPLESSS